MSDTCSTLATDVQDIVLESAVQVTLDVPYSGTVFKVTDDLGRSMTCILAGVVAPIVNQPGFDQSLDALRNVLSEVSFTILPHSRCARWYPVTPVSVIANNEDVTMRLLESGWVRLDEYIPKKLHRALYSDKTYFAKLQQAQREASLAGRGLNENPVTRDAFMHPKDYYDAVLKDQGQALCFYFASDTIQSDYQPPVFD